MSGGSGGDGEFHNFSSPHCHWKKNKMKKDYAKKYQKKESNLVETFMVGFAFFGVIYLWVQLYV